MGAGGGTESIKQIGLYHDAIYAASTGTWPARQSSRVLKLTVAINPLFKRLPLGHALPRGCFDLPVFVTPTIVTLLLAAAPEAAAPPAHAAPPADRIQLAQVTIEQRVIIRVPMTRTPAPPPPPPPPNGRTAAAMAPRVTRPVAPPLSFKEVKGPKCLQLGKLRGAMMGSNAGVVMLTAGEDRYRPHFSRSCRPADFYAGFYIEPNKDGSLCAGRDVFHTRNGSSCEIERFVRIVPDTGDDEEDDD